MPKHQIILPNIAKDFLMFAKVAKFRQIWSHWLVIRFLAKSVGGVLPLTYISSRQLALRPGADVINKFYHSITMLCWNDSSLRLDVPSRTTFLPNQSVLFQHSATTLCYIMFQLVCNLFSRLVIYICNFQSLGLDNYLLI